MTPRLLMVCRRSSAACAAGTRASARAAASAPAMKTVPRSMCLVSLLRSDSLAIDTSGGSHLIGIERVCRLDQRGRVQAVEIERLRNGAGGKQKSLPRLHVTFRDR